MSTKKRPNQYIAALAAGSITPATLQKQLAKLAQELDDAVFFNYPKSDIKAIETDILDIQEALSAGVGEFEQGLRERHASYKPEKKSSGYDYGPKEAGFANYERKTKTDWTEALGYRAGYYGPARPLPEEFVTPVQQRIADLEKHLANLKFDLQDAVKFREPQDYVDRLREAIMLATRELEETRTLLQKKNPGRRKKASKKRRRR